MGVGFFSLKERKRIPLIHFNKKSDEVCDHIANIFCRNISLRIFMQLYKISPNTHNIEKYIKYNIQSILYNVRLLKWFFTVILNHIIKNMNFHRNLVIITYLIFIRRLKVNRRNLRLLQPNLNWSKRIE